MASLVYQTLFVALMASLIVSDAALAARPSSSKGAMDMAQAPSRRLLQASEFCANPPPCPVPATRNVTCRAGGVIGCECYFVGRCFPEARGCYMLNGTDKTFCGF